MKNQSKFHLVLLCLLFAIQSNAQSPSPNCNPYLFSNYHPDLPIFEVVITNLTSDVYDMDAFDVWDPITCNPYNLIPSTTLLPGTTISNLLPASLFNYGVPSGFVKGWQIRCSHTNGNTFTIYDFEKCDPSMPAVYKEPLTGANGNINACYDPNGFPSGGGPWINGTTPYPMLYITLTP
jgi:hypothetical protein